MFTAMNSGIPVMLQFTMPVIQFGIIILAAKLSGRIAQFVRFPHYIGELAAGIILGPYMLGSLNIPWLEGSLFPVMQNSMLPVPLIWYALASFSAAMIAFIYGMRADMNLFSRSALSGFLVSISGFIPSFIFGSALSMIMLHTGVLDPRCLFLGLLCSVSQVSVSAKILSKKHSLNLAEGRTIVSAGMTEPLIGMFLLFTLLLLFGRFEYFMKLSLTKLFILIAKTLSVWAAAAFFSWFLSYKYAFFIRFFRSPSVIALLFLGLILLPAGCFEQAGFVMIIGAFIMGLTFSRLPAAVPVQNELHILFELLSSLFFVVMGMCADIRVFTDKRILLFALLYSLLAILAKLIGCSLASLCMKHSFMTALRTGAGMIPRGEITLLFASIGTASVMVLNNKMTAVIDSKLFGVAVFMIIFTTVVTLPLLSLLFSKRIHTNPELSEQLQTVYEFPTEEFASFMYKKLIGNFRAEGYFHYEMDPNHRLTYFHRENQTFSLEVNHCTFVFESSPQEVIVVKTVAYETIIDLYRSIGKLRKAAIPGVLDSGEDSSVFNNAEAEVDNLLEKVVPPGCITTDLQAESQEEAIVELVQLLGDNGHLADTRECAFDALSRESIISTCTPDKVAFPHARTAGTRKMAAAIGISRKGYKEFGTSGQEIRIVVLSVCPPEDDQTYLQFVASVSAKLNDPEYFRKLLEAEDVATIRVLLSEHK